MEERTNEVSSVQREILFVYHLRSNWCSKVKASILNLEEKENERRTSERTKNHRERFCVNSVETVFDFLFPIATKNENLLLHFARLDATFYTRGRNRGSPKNERRHACRSLNWKICLLSRKNQNREDLHRYRTKKTILEIQKRGKNRLKDERKTKVLWKAVAKH